MNHLVKSIKRKATDWKKIFAYHASDKGLVSKIYKQTLSKLKVKKTNKNQVIQLESVGGGGISPIGYTDGTQVHKEFQYH